MGLLMFGVVAGIVPWPVAAQAVPGSARQAGRPGALATGQRPGLRDAQQTPALKPGELPVNEARPKGQMAADEPLVFDFENTELMNIIKSLGARTGLNFEVDPAIGKQNVTVITHDVIPAEMAYFVLESILTSRGYSMVPSLDGNLIKIRSVGEDKEKYPLHIGGKEVPPGYDSFSTHIVAVKYAGADEVAPLLRSLGSKYARVDAYAKTNTLILTDTADGLRNILIFLQEIDVPGYDTTMEIFVLEYTRAETLAQQIQDVLMGPAGGQPGGRAAPQAVRRPTPSPRRPTVPGQRQPLVVGSREETLRMVPDERLNALIVVATESLMERVRDLIDKLDRPTPYEANNLHIYPLLNADAEQVAEALNALVSTTPRQGAQKGGGPTAEVQPFEKQVMISTYEQTNALLVVAAPQDYTLLEAIIAQLDVPQRQVAIEAVIMDVIINDSFDLSVELASLSANDAFVLNNVVQLANILALGPLAAAGTGVTLGVIDGTVDISVPDGAGGLVRAEIPKIPLLYTALETLTDVDVLSMPSLTTVDNQEASITVGQEVPFITGSARSLNQSAVGASVFSRIERQEVGIKLTVTPQISEGDFVNMELEVEVSKTVQSDIGGDPNIVGPTVQLSRVEDNVVIKDGSTGLIAGLISESTDHSRTQTPVLGDLPVVGWLFRQRADRRSKRNLVVLVTPHIVKGSHDLDRVTSTKLVDFRTANIDVLFERGIIRKIKRKKTMRTQYRPSAARVEEILSEEGFGRGDMKRGDQ